MLINAAPDVWNKRLSRGVGTQSEALGRHKFSSALTRRGSLDQSMPESDARERCNWRSPKPSEVLLRLHGLRSLLHGLRRHSGRWPLHRHGGRWPLHHIIRGLRRRLHGLRRRLLWTTAQGHNQPPPTSQQGHDTTTRQPAKGATDHRILHLHITHLTTTMHVVRHSNLSG